MVSVDGLLGLLYHLAVLKVRGWLMSREAGGH